MRKRLRIWVTVKVRPAAGRSAGDEVARGEQEDDNRGGCGEGRHHDCRAAQQPTGRSAEDDEVASEGVICSQAPAHDRDPQNEGESRTGEQGDGKHGGRQRTEPVEERARGAGRSYSAG